MAIEQWIGGAAVVGVGAAFWQQIKTFLVKVFTLIFFSIKLDNDTKEVLLLYLHQNHIRKLRWGSGFFRSGTEYVKPKKRIQYIGWESLTKQSWFFFYNPIPFLFTPGIKNNESPTPAKEISESDTIASVRFVRFTLNWDALLIKALDHYNKVKDGTNSKDRFGVFRKYGAGSLLGRRSMNNNGQSTAPAYASPGSYRGGLTEMWFGDKRVLKWGKADLGVMVSHDTSSSALNVLAFPPKVEEILTEIEKWKLSEDWYRSKNIPWRRGWLLYGKPGVGKSSLVKAIAYDMDLPIYLFDLSTMSNEELVNNWREILFNIPCVALIEDIDAVFCGRDNKLGEMGGGLSFDCLLNTISGVEGSDGIFLIVTTNRVEELDEALGIPKNNPNGTLISTRPGRIDRALELPMLDENCRKKMAGRILADCPQFVDELVKLGEGDSGAQFQERLTQVALSDHWSHRKK